MNINQNQAPASKPVTIIGGGFAGVEAAWAVAQRGGKVTLYEMRPEKATPVHRTGDLAELVCSNSFKSALLTNASGTLKEEMRRLGSLILPVAEKFRVPAGEALAVDREPFAAEITRLIGEHPNITVIRDEVGELPSSRPLIISSGPLTSPALARSLAELTGSESLSFYDAVAPTITLESIDMSKAFRASRRGRNLDENDEAENEGDYINCPFEKEDYFAFHKAITEAELAGIHSFEEVETPEKMVFFEMCVPVEELARRGPRTLAFGAMKPIGLTDPRTGNRPYACVQLRQENKAGTLWGLVGFQTRMKWGEQKRVFRMIPGLENAEFVRYGVMHRNTYINAPKLLDTVCQLNEHPGVFIAGQLTGVEGYLESAAIGIVAGLNAYRQSVGLLPATPPRETVLGSLCYYLVESNPNRFSPMNSNWGVVPELENCVVKDKREKASLKSERALAAIDLFVQSLEYGTSPFV